jgi:glucose dehydrogenase
MAARYRRPDGSGQRVTAKVFVVAAHAIETPKLLLMSRGVNAPNGVANSSDRVGRNLMDHPVQLSWALAKDPVWPYRRPLSTSGLENTRAGRATRPAFRIEIGNHGWSWPRPRIGYRLDDYTKAGLAEARRIHDEAFRRMGASKISHMADGEFQGAGHVMGTTRMGKDAKTAVVDADLRAFDHPNLFIQGSAVFPTAGAANPTLTIAALALRSVDAIRKTVRG